MHLILDHFLALFQKKFWPLEKLKILLNSNRKMGYEHTLNSNRKMGYEHTLNSNRKRGYEHTLNSNKKMVFECMLKPNVWLRILTFFQ